MKYDIEKVTEPVQLTRTEFEKIGHGAAIEYEISDIKKVGIWGKYFGLYQFFTVPTQHCYCTKDDMYYILGMVKYCKDNEAKSFNTFYSKGNERIIKYAFDMEYEHMKMVYKELFGKEYDGPKDNKILYEKLDKEYHVGNYFYYYRMYIYRMASYEHILGIKNYN